MNFVHIVGRLAKDVETRFTANGQKVIVLIVATSVHRSGTDETIWWRVTFWGDRHEKILPYLTKGKPIMVGGELSSKPQLYTDKNGVQQVGSLEIRGEYVKFVPFNNKEQSEQDMAQPAEAAPRTGMAHAGATTGTAPSNPMEEDDQLPF